MGTRARIHVKRVGRRSNGVVFGFGRGPFKGWPVQRLEAIARPRLPGVRKGDPDEPYWKCCVECPPLCEGCYRTLTQAPRAGAAAQ